VGPLPNLSIVDGPKELLEHQLADREISRLKVVVTGSDKPGVVSLLTKDLMKFQSALPNLWIDKAGLLLCKIQRLEKATSVPVVPESQLEPVAVAYHKLLGHAGRDKVLDVLRTRYFHPGFATVVAQVVRQCPICQVHKGRTPHNYPLYRRKTSQPYEMYAVDLMDLPKSKGGYTCILVGIDLHTKFAHAVPLRSKTSQAVSKAFESNILATVPKTPAVILSDSGPEFRGKPFRELLEQYGVQHDRSVPYAPHTNGAVERLNQTIRSRLAAACHEDQREWDKKLCGVVAQYNRVPHAETGRPPAEFFI
jgi:transposase InsO family protein